MHCICLHVSIEDAYYCFGIIVKQRIKYVPCIISIESHIVTLDTDIIKTTALKKLLVIKRWWKQIIIFAYVSD